MNNARIAIESFKEEEAEAQEISALEQLPALRKREGELVTLIEALRRVEESDDWSTLKTALFDGVVENLEKRLKSESTKPEINTSEIYKLQGQLAWAKKYSDLGTLARVFRLELTNITQQLNGK